MKIWTCKIGEIPHGADAPMRMAVEQAYRQLAGKDSDFLFSGWGGNLYEIERAVVENRLPDSLKDVPHAFEAIKTAIHMDAGYAWVWHCNIAVCMQDEGAPYDSANAAAARFMQMCFGWTPPSRQLPLVWQRDELAPANVWDKLGTTRPAQI